jgi:hypothetical protein
MGPPRLDGPPLDADIPADLPPPPIDPEWIERRPAGTAPEEDEDT